MTTIIAVRKHGRTCIVSDSLITYGGRRKEAYGHLLAPTAKLIRCGDAIVGFTGSASWAQVFNDFLFLSVDAITDGSAEVLQGLFSNFWASFKSGCGFAQIPDERFTSFSCCQIVIARSDGLFEVTVEGCVVENKNIVAIGDGRPFSFGAIKALDSLTQDPFDLAMAGIKAAALWDPCTQGPFLGWRISELGEFTEFASGQL